MCRQPFQTIDPVAGRPVPEHTVTMLSRVVVGFFVGFVASSSAAQPEAAPPAPVVDNVAPTIANFSVAADNPEAAPVISVSVRDDVGVTSAVCHWQAAGGIWNATPMAGTSFRIARLPEGTQATGFNVYVEVADAAGNVARAGSADEPIAVAKALRGNVARVQAERAAANNVEGPHPGWIMLGLGVGVLGAGGAGIFGYDLALTGTRLAAIDDELGGSVSRSRREDLEASRTALQKVQVQDATGTVVLGVVGLAGLVTGTTLLVMAVAAQE
jgi:hypothetical protein